MRETNIAWDFEKKYLVVPKEREPIDPEFTDEELARRNEFDSVDNFTNFVDEKIKKSK